MADGSHRLTITELGSLAPDIYGRQGWSVRITLDGRRSRRYRKKREVYDPFTRSDRKNHAYYINRGLHDSIWMDKNGNRESMAEIIERYPGQLLAALDLTAFERELTHPHLKIDIYEPKNVSGPGGALKKASIRRQYTDPLASSPIVSTTRRVSEPAFPTASPAYHSINGLYWEHLENVDVWPEAFHRVIRKVTVRRLVEIDRLARDWGRGTALELHPAKTFTNVQEYNILLVVAREISSRGLDVDPTLIHRAILDVQRQLAQSGLPHKINLEIVRPGSFEELQTHLIRKKKDTQLESFFHFVHFDVHGELGPAEGDNFDGDRDAYLIFQTRKEHQKDQLYTTKVNAKRLAPLLREHGVNCAVLNACESAKATESFGANLSRVFVCGGVPHVLAMSQKISCSLSEKFFTAFYSKIFIDTLEFAEAAAQARQVIKNDPDRINRSSNNEPLLDWFVPVAYTVRKSVVVRRINPEITINDSSFWSEWVAVVFSVWSWITLFGSLAFTYWNAIDAEKATSQERIACNTLGQNILQVEGALCAANMVCIFNSSKTTTERKKADGLVESLTNTWMSTHFIGYPITIKAEWYLQHPWIAAVQQMWHRTWVPYSDNNNHQPVHTSRNESDASVAEKGSSLPQKLDKKTLIILENAHELFVHNSKRHQRAQEKLYRAIEYTMRHHSIEGDPPYLIVLASGDKKEMKANFDRSRLFKNLVYHEFKPPPEFENSISNNREKRVLSRR